ncbi:MAG: CsbD family protein [Acidovorax sp.]
MTLQHISARIDLVLGAIKEALGRLFGSRPLQAKGIAQQYAGRVALKLARSPQKLAAQSV